MTRPTALWRNLPLFVQVLAISAQLRLTVRQMDVDTAFLNAPIHEDIRVRMSKDTPLADDDDGIYKLKKSLYGLKQAPREWNNHINGFFKGKRIPTYGGRLLHLYTT